MKRKIMYLLFGLFVMLALALPVQAGGWAVFTIEDYPARIVAGEALTIELAVRQHGVHLTSSFGTPAIYARHSETGERLKFEAKPTKQTGYFVAEMLFPRSGTWTWSIGWAQSADHAQTMVPFTVQPSEGFAEPTATSQNPSPMILSMIGSVIIVGAAGMMFATRKWQAFGVGVVGVLFLLVGVIGAGQRPVVAVEEGPVSSLSQVELGAALFKAKGCVVCHSHAEGRAGYAGIMTNVGPNLTKTALSPDYLFVWLKDPSSVKPETEMPNLGLDKLEMEALVAFLTAHQ